MASFQVVREDTGIQYTIKVAEFVYRNTYGTDSSGNVTSLEPTGYTSITSLGDNIIQKLGREALEARTKFYFVNHPECYIQMDALNKLSTFSRFVDPTDNNNQTMIAYSKYYAAINIYRNGSVYTKLCGYYKIMSKHSGTSEEETLSNTIPAFAPIYEPFWSPQIAFNFSQQKIAVISPYYYQMQTFGFSKNFSFTSANGISYGNMTPIYIGKPFTIKNGLVNTNEVYYLYNYDTNKETLNPTDITNYQQLSNQKYIGTAGSFVNDIRTTQTFQIISDWNFWYWLLMDTDSEDNPYPENPDNKDPSGQSKPNTGGNGNNPSGGNPSSDIISNPSLPTVNPISTGSVNLYQMDADTFREFMSYLWSNPFYTAFIKLFQDPMQAVISSHIIGIAVPTIRQDYITIGNVTTTVQANVVKNNFVRANFSYIQIPEFYADASDYLETVVELYLPYHGYVTLNTFEVMGANVYLEYTIDVLTGSFVAVVTVSKTIEDTTLNSVLYQYNGNMAYQIPLSSVDYSSYITASLSAIGALTQKRIGSIVGGLVDSALSIDIGYDRASTLTANTGYMSVKEAYVTILRPIHAQAPNFAHYVGYPYEGYVTLGSCSGLTICREVYINNVLGTEEETKEIRSLLMEGVIF